ncbi:hypothetical protein AD998_04990 [bacterium 336/3]|nr:hypothetical protein AD998_04990 [bacterium 336/3]
MPKSYYTLIQIVPNLSANDRLSIGLIGFDENSVKFRFSDLRKTIAIKLLNSNSIINYITTQIDKKLSQNVINLEAQIQTKGANDTNWIGSYLDYLQKYSNGTLQFSEPILILDSLTEARFDSLYDSLLATNYQLDDERLNLNNNIENQENNNSFDISENNSNPQNRISEDDFFKHTHIIDQLYFSLKRFEDILVLPRNFLMNLYPFNKSRDEYSYLGNYSLQTRNKELLDFFDKITTNVDEVEYNIPEELDNVDNYDEKLKFILKQLNHAQILYVWLDKKENEYKNIILENHINCDCILCSYQDFNFARSAQLLQETNTENKNEAMDNAFAHYLFGNYFTSAQCYIDLEAKLKKDEKNILRLICVHNIVKLSKYDTEIEWLISEGFIDRIKGEQVIEQFKNVDEWKTIGDMNVSKKEKELLEWIKEEKTFYYGFTEITDSSKKLIDNYHRIKNGGTVWSQEIDGLKVELNELILFYVGNGLIFQHFKEFYDIVALATEAFIASHSIPKDKDSSKLKHFDDTLLSNIVLYCHAEDLDKCFDKYQVKEINYQSNSYMFWDRVNNFFDSKNNLSLILPLLKERTNRKFLGTYKNICKNLLLVLGYMKVETESFEMILEKILNFWKETPIITKDREMQHFLKGFLSLKEEDLKNEKLSEVLFDFLKFLSTIDEFKHQHLQIMRLLVWRFEKYDRNYQIDDIKIIEKILVNSQNERELLVYIYPIIAENFKNLIIEKLQSYLYEKFDIYIFYEAMYAGMLDYKEYFDKIIEGKHYEAAISIGYKYRLDFQDTVFQEIKTHSPYFEWLIEPESFDYSLFQIKWIHEIRYTSLREIIWKSQKLKEYLEKYLKDNDNENLRKFYFSYIV